MGKKQRKYDALMASLQAKLDAYANTPSQWETQLGNEATGITNFLNSKDYRNMPTGVNVDLLPLADYQRMRKMTQGTNTGQGQINPNILAAQREVGDNEFVQQWGNAYENKVGELSGRRDNLTGMLQGLYQDRMTQGIQGAQAQIQNFLNRPKGFSWGNLFGGILNAAPGILQGLGSMGATI